MRGNSGASDIESFHVNAHFGGAEIGKVRSAQLPEQQWHGRIEPFRCGSRSEGAQLESNQRTDGITISSISLKTHRTWALTWTDEWANDERAIAEVRVQVLNSAVVQRAPQR